MNERRTYLAHLMESEAIKEKPWWKSKTIWFNIGVGAEIAVSTLLESNIIPGSSIIGVVGNIILRLITKTRLTRKKEKEIISQ